MQNRDIINQVARRLRDVSQKEWKQDILLASLNSALQSVVNVRPESNTVQRNIMLVEGHEQRIDSDLHKLIHVLHNVNSFTGKAERAVTLADMGTLDDVFPDWRCDSPREFIEHYMLTDTDDRVFHVWPPALPAPIGEEPVAVERPVNPGAATTGIDDIELDAWFFVDSNGLRNEFVLEWPENSPDSRATDTSTVPVALAQSVWLDFVSNTNTRYIVTFRNSPDGIWNRDDTRDLNSISDRIYPHGYYDGISNGLLSISNNGSIGVGDIDETYLAANEVFREDGTLLIIHDEDIDRLVIEDPSYQEVTHQDVTDYLELVSAYNSYVAAYNAYFSQEPGNQLRIEASIIPVVLEEELDNDIPMGLHYVPALQEWMLYYCYAVDDEMTPNQARAENHFRHFFNLMDIKLKNSMRIHEIRTEVD